MLLKTSVKHKQKEGLRSDLALESVFCSSLFIVKYSFNATSDACIDNYHSIFFDMPGTAPPSDEIVQGTF